jgi:thioredoxin-like negative regulator of GroEL
MIKCCQFTIAFLSCFILIAQNEMQEGFTLLEKGDFEEAESFFIAYLKNNPENKTAKLCYGRAVGLSGEPEKATGLFAELLED